jgi:predicted esterase
MDRIERPDVKVVSVEAATHGRVLVREAEGAGARGVLLGFHGYMENADLQLDRLRMIPGSDGWTLASIQALSRFYRGRTDEVVASWMTRQDREQMMADNVRYVERAVAAVGLPGRSPPPNVVSIGFSQGAAMAFRAGVRCRFRTLGIVSVGADVPPDLLGDTTARFPPVLFARGVRDEWLTADVFDRDLAALRQQRVDVRPLAYDGAHEWNESVAEAVGQFVGSLPA